MKKVFLAIVLAAVAATSAFAQLSIGVGYLSNTQKETLNSHSETADYNGFYAGVDYSLIQAGAFSFTPGIYVSSLNRKITILNNDVKINEFNINIPANFSLGIDFSNAVRGFVYAGPTFLFGISSTAKAGNEKQDLYKDTDYSRFNVLLGGGIGVDLSDVVRISAGYNAGLLNRNKERNSGIKLTEGGFHVGVAFLFR